MSSFGASTIVALATPSGVGGIAVIRISGPASIDTAISITNRPADDFRPRHALLTPLFDFDGLEIDQAVVTFFPAPNSYTGEDVLEISSHGGYVVPKNIIKACILYGCDAAAPGEFTKRAFLNGKMDLSQAEAVAELISAKTDVGRAASYKIMSGKFANLINLLRQQLVDFLSVIEAELDFDLSEVPELTVKERIESLNSVLATVKKLLLTYETGRRIVRGAVVVIVGAPNVGKSSLLNAILSERRVIVSTTPGTTRDPVEVQYQINGLPVQIIDTAGNRPASDEIESSGLSIAQSFIDRADLLLWVHDNTSSPSDLSDSIANSPYDHKFIPVLNKSDLLSSKQKKQYTNSSKRLSTFLVSALTGSGIAGLVTTIGDLMAPTSTDSEILLTNARHFEALTSCFEHLECALSAVSDGTPLDVLALHVRSSLSSLDSIVGRTTSDEIINNIFSGFCVGK